MTASAVIANLSRGNVSPGQFAEQGHAVVINPLKEKGRVRWNLDQKRRVGVALRIEDGIPVASVFSYREFPKDLKK